MIDNAMELRGEIKERKQLRAYRKIQKKYDLKIRIKFIFILKPSFNLFLPILVKAYARIYSFLHIVCEQIIWDRHRIIIKS